MGMMNIFRDNVMASFHPEGILTAPLKFNNIHKHLRNQINLCLGSDSLLPYTSSHDQASQACSFCCFHHRMIYHFYLLHPLTKCSTTTGCFLQSVHRFLCNMGGSKIKIKFAPGDTKIHGRTFAPWKTLVSGT